MNNIWGIGIFFLFFALYWWLLAKLVGAILESSRLKQSRWLLIGIFNAAVLCCAFGVWPKILFSYYLMMALMLLELGIFYKDKFSGILLCTLACAIHVIGLFMITITIISFRMNRTPYEILQDQFVVFWCCSFAFFLLDFAIIIVLKLVPLLKVKLINQHKEQRWFIISWMIINTLFLVYLADLLVRPNYLIIFTSIQLAASITCMIGLYIILFFSIKTSAILGYKEKNTELEHAILQEQQYRNSMVHDAIASYEVNITKDLMLKGFEDKESELGDLIHHFSDMLVYMSQKLIYPGDVTEYIEHYRRENILRLFEKGEYEFTAEYRRLFGQEGYIWVKSIFNLVQDMETGDIKAFVCVKNIDVEKKKQLEFQHKAERDLLTGLYNRSAASKRIDEHLASGHSSIASALYMIDVDNFKEINDHFGHVYGDAVLCELADKLQHIFRNSDIVGRIGGDEYIVFLKDGATLQKTMEKAKQICESFSITYEGTDGVKHGISGSVGVSVSPKDGVTFSELYAHADIALYEAKNKGKNGYRMYDGGTFSGYTSNRTEIVSQGYLKEGER